MAVGRAESFLFDRGASIHQGRRKVLSEPCWIVTHHTALKSDPGRLKALEPYAPSSPDFDECDSNEKEGYFPILEALKASPRGRTFKGSEFLS